MIAYDISLNYELTQMKASKPLVVFGVDKHNIEINTN
jgi:hypothetical protein